jgi:hypothetical protein
MAVVAVVVVGVVGMMKFHDELFKPKSPMEQLLAEMNSAPDELINEWAADAEYYLEEVNSL